MKFKFIHLIWLSIFVYIVARLYLTLNPPITLQKSLQEFCINPETTVFVFDLHGVVFKKNIYEMFQLGWQAPEKFSLLLTFLNPFFLYDFFTLFLEGDAVEKYISLLTEKYPSLNKYIPLAISITNAQDPIPSTVAFIKKLKKDGYKLYVFSNIGEKTFQALQKKYPELFSYFDGAEVIEHHDNWLQKPTPQAYKKFLQRFNLKPENIIFIDDKKENLIPAQQLRFNTIHYQNEKQFYGELCRIKVCDKN